MSRALLKIRTFYDSVGPNPWVVRLAFALKGVDFAPFTQKLTLADGKPENRVNKDLLRKNPAGTTPFMELSDGTVISESVTMVRYIDELYSDQSNSLTGVCPLEQARISMWQRRLEINIITPYQRQFQYGEGLPYFKNYVSWVEASAVSVPALRDQVLDQLSWVEKHCFQTENDLYLAGGSDISIVDLQLFATHKFMGKVNKAKLTDDFDPFRVDGFVETKLPKLNQWAKRMDTKMKTLGQK